MVDLMKPKLKVVLYGIKGKPVIGWQTEEVVIQRIKYGEIVTYLGTAPWWIVDYGKQNGINIVAEKWENEIGTQMYIKEEEGTV